MNEQCNAHVNETTTTLALTLQMILPIAQMGKPSCRIEQKNREFDRFKRPGSHRNYELTRSTPSQVHLKRKSTIMAPESEWQRSCCSIVYQTSDSREHCTIELCHRLLQRPANFQKLPNTAHAPSASGKHISKTTQKQQTKPSSECSSL